MISSIIIGHPYVMKTLFYTRKRRYVKHINVKNKFTFTLHTHLVLAKCIYSVIVNFNETNIESEFIIKHLTKTYFRILNMYVINKHFIYNFYTI